MKQLEVYSGFPELFGGTTPESKKGEYNWVEFKWIDELLIHHAEKIARVKVPENGCLWIVFRQDSISLKIKKARYGERPNPCDFNELAVLVRLDAWDLRHRALGIIKKARRLSKRTIYPSEYLLHSGRAITEGH
jgi:hypothetical protein